MTPFTLHASSCFQTHLEETYKADIFLNPSSSFLFHIWNQMHPDSPVELFFAPHLSITKPLLLRTHHSSAHLFVQSVCYKEAELLVFTASGAVGVPLGPQRVQFAPRCQKTPRIIKHPTACTLLTFSRTQSPARGSLRWRT
ncbi:hypothetical protein EYF80_063656 [Liparis tanakae]|uniref:Uncharacterized protein n=1 Tax=Liparis tanakae TaxID=230148 RepID=A0A4Z2EBF0_9TELE|nr:hypothetical protein EYF80_063656 [Liparis tanakae]